jgi:hypothetical protein
MNRVNFGRTDGVVNEVAHQTGWEREFLVQSMECHPCSPSSGPCSVILVLLVSDDLVIGAASPSAGLLVGACSSMPWTWLSSCSRSAWRGRQVTWRLQPPPKGRAWPLTRWLRHCPWRPPQLQRKRSCMALLRPCSRTRLEVGSKGRKHMPALQCRRPALTGRALTSLVIESGSCYHACHATMQQMCLKVSVYLCEAWGRTGTAFSLPSKGPAFLLLLVWTAKMSMHQVVQKARIGPVLP